MTEGPQKPGRGPRGGRRKDDADTIDTRQVYKATTDKLPGIAEGSLLRVMAKDDTDAYIVMSHQEGTRANFEGQQVRGLVPRTVRITPALFDKNTEKTDERYRDE